MTYFHLDCLLCPVSIIAKFYFGSDQQLNTNKFVAVQLVRQLTGGQLNQEREEVQRLGKERARGVLMSLSVDNIGGHLVRNGHVELLRQLIRCRCDLDHESPCDDIREVDDRQLERYSTCGRGVSDSDGCEVVECQTDKLRARQVVIDTHVVRLGQGQVRMIEHSCYANQR